MKEFIEHLTKSTRYDLSMSLMNGMTTSPTHPGFTMALAARHGDVVRKHGLSGADELVVMSGHSGTHIDALCHVAVDGRFHGGIDALKAQGARGFTSLGVETIGPIVGRGVLFDFPRLKGVEVLDPGYGITGEDFEWGSKKIGVTVEAGDAVLVRTGWAKATAGDSAAYLGWTSGVPGPDASGASWLGERGVRVTGTDTIAYERIAPGAGHTDMPVHASLIVEYGIHIIECLNLEDLAADGVTVFGFVCAPLRIAGATGSPVTPVAFVLDDDE